MNWATTVRQLRRSLQLNQISFSLKLDVSQAAVSRWEKGIDIPNRQARTKIIDMTRNSNRAFQDASVVLRTRFASCSVHILNGKGRVIEMSEACATDLGRTRSDLMSRKSLMGAFGDEVDAKISTLATSGLFDAGVIGVNCQARFDRTVDDRIETRGISLWIHPVFMNDGEVLANCSHSLVSATDIKQSGVFETLHIDQVCI